MLPSKSHCGIFFFFHSFVICILRSCEKCCQIFVRIFCHFIGSDSHCDKCRRNVCYWQCAGVLMQYLSQNVHGEMPFSFSRDFIQSDFVFWKKIIKKTKSSYLQTPFFDVVFECSLEQFPDKIFSFIQIDFWHKPSWKSILTFKPNI